MVAPYYAWCPNELPMLREGNIGAAKLALEKNGFALPRSDSAKVAYVLQGSGVAGIVLPEKEEKVLPIKKGDAIALPFGVVTWVYNKEDTELVVLFLGDTSKAHKSGSFTDFFLTGIVKLDPSCKMPEPKKEHYNGMALNCEEAPLDVDIKDGGKVVVLNTKNLPLVGEVGLGADLVRLNGKAMCSPGFSCDSALQVTYIVRGSGRVQVVGVDGKRVLETTIKAGSLFIVPRFFVVSKIADPDGMDWFSIITTPTLFSLILPEGLQFGRHCLQKCSRQLLEFLQMLSRSLAQRGRLRRSSFHHQTNQVWHFSLLLFFRPKVRIPPRPPLRDLGLILPSSVGGRRCSLRQAARRLLDESSSGEGDEEDEDSSLSKKDIVPKEERGLLGTRGNRPLGSVSSPPPPLVDFGVGQGGCPKGGDHVAPSRRIGPGAGGFHKKKLEDRVERLLGDIAKLKDLKKKAVGRYQQVEKEVKKLQREVKTLKEDHTEELQMLANQVQKEFPEIEEGKNYLEACWASRLALYKKSEDYKREVAMVANLYLRFAFKYGCSRCEEDLDHILGEAEAEVRSDAGQAEAATEEGKGQDECLLHLGSKTSWVLRGGPPQEEEKEDVRGKAPLVG
ncbi:11S globulin subunit beta [Sesamum angolense]|uniref:11S globulin subunit beta n=1 Tax=Sesamum angolense TaxID=2727404 RepID=A0AAE1X0E9_9LAMI|nr:11S globulin subunit beta [Sesamum angolense]